MSTDDSVTELICEVCYENYPNRRVKSVVAPDRDVFYCTECMEHEAEPFAFVSLYLAHTPMWAIPADILYHVTTYDGDIGEYIGIPDLLERNDDDNAAA